MKIKFTNEVNVFMWWRKQFFHARKRQLLTPKRVAATNETDNHKDLPPFMSVGIEKVKNRAFVLDLKMLCQKMERNSHSRPAFNLIEPCLYSIGVMNGIN